jgi:hypothetical protein
MRMLRLPSPSIVIAATALLIALSATAVAAPQIVPLAKRALTADKAKVALNARKVGGQTPASLLRRAASQASTVPGPASTATDIVVVKNQAAGQIAAGAGKAFSISCDAGQKIVSAGFMANGPVLIAVGSYPASETSWTMGLLNLDGATPANVTMYATCLK